MDNRLKLVTILSNSAPTPDNMIQWTLDDNAASDVVTGSELNGALVGGNTADVAATVNGKPAFHLNGSTQYVQVTIPNAWPSAVRNLWTKHPNNPVLTDTPTNVRFGCLAAKPGGGWYFFGPWGGASICRWQSTDLVTWTNKTTCLSSIPAAWDETFSGVTCFQRASDGLWIMLYRGGTSAANFAIGRADSEDGATFTRRDNQGVDDGKFLQFGSNYDPIGTILVGTRYYQYVNGDPNHGVESVYYSDDDFETFTANPNNPILPRAVTSSTNQTFCPCVWTQDGYYYMIISRQCADEGTDLYLYSLMLYRSTTPTFDADTTDFLGYTTVNDQVYDRLYLDVPSTPHTDIRRDTLGAEFGDTLYMMYMGRDESSVPAQSLCWTNKNSLSGLRPRIDRLHGGRLSYSFWVQFDSLASLDPIFSIGSSATDTSPVWFCAVRFSSPNYHIGLYLNSTYKLSSSTLAINTPYHVVIVDSFADRKLYINNSLVGTFTEATNRVDDLYLFLGKGGARFLDGYIWDFRIYPDDLSAEQVTRLYQTGYAG